MGVTGQHRAYVITTRDGHRCRCACGWKRREQDFATALALAESHPRSLEITHPVPAGATKGFTE